MEIFDPMFNSLERAMKIETMKQAITAHNIANAKTPGYVAMTFDEHLMRAVRREDKKEVVLEEELAALAENKYSAYVKMMTNKLGVMRSIVTQGRK